MRLRPAVTSGHQPLRQLLAMSACVLLSACTVYTEIKPQALGTPAVTQPVNAPQDLFVFFDGTSNDPGSRTNVWQLFDYVSKHGSASTKSLYIEGVGNTRNPITGMLFGFGMEKRLGMAYEFLTANYRSGQDRIYIIGFSRGSHQARALAGMLSYSGIPHDRKLPGRSSNKIREATKNTSDAAHSWVTWSKGQGPMLAADIMEETGLAMDPVEVQFLGIWDSVPGSLFKRKEFPVGACKETPPTGANQRESKLSTERYKSDSYPPIAVIAHAVSADEKRSRFRPLFVCDPINPKATRVYQTWFPGAHSDVGGGYPPDTHPGAPPPLSNVTFNWMVRLLGESYTFRDPQEPREESPLGLAHWSIGNRPGNLFSACEDRERPLPHDEHESVTQRRGAPVAPILIKGKRDLEKYPKRCPEM